MDIKARTNYLHFKTTDLISIFDCSELRINSNQFKRKRSFFDSQWRKKWFSFLKEKTNSTKILSGL
ncbi:hypothetical protein BpHYR1_011623 [Brachionus plicatilis]|uniref:Uncharacterized protein n=1 Tax=Brachionus plicatilis TaxID=10195 RepID=A0A3M7S3U6_BRAPC|nr:hypothetical protein BpHYR1_011623 [Brachionus plicatilis]